MGALLGTRPKSLSRQPSREAAKTAAIEHQPFDENSHWFEDYDADGNSRGHATVEERPDHVWVQKMQVNPHERGKGVGSGLLDHIQRHFGGKPLRLKPYPVGEREEDPDEEQLREWYGNRGFTDYQVKPGDDHDAGDWMERHGAGEILRNPSTKGTEWYHGTRASSAQLAGGFRVSDEDPDPAWPAHWSTGLGVHFAAHHSMANRFADPAVGVGGKGGAADPEHSSTPSVVHARLHLANPKVYADEDRMADDVFEHEHGERKNYISGYIKDDDERLPYAASTYFSFDHHPDEAPGRGEYEHFDDFEDHGEWGEERPSPVYRREQWLNLHPDQAGIARRHRERLQAQGHDGIVYTNSAPDERVRSSKPESNQVAIAFHPHQVEITKHHVFGDEHKTAAARWSPSSGVFGPTTGHDPTLFDGDELRPEVRRDVMERLDQALRVDTGLVGSDWQDWTKVYLAGGSASEWAGARPNDAAEDLDILIGVNYFEARRGSGAFADMDSSQIDTAFNTALRAAFNDPDWHPAFGGTWQLTGYVNPDAYDITKIKPYAAYNITDMTWAVHPPHLPEHTLADFDPAILAMARAMATEARAILRLPEPARTHEARALWERLHSDRRRAFSDEGEGWQDPGNLIEKYLAYAPGKLLERIKELALAKPAATMTAARGDLSDRQFGRLESRLLGKGGTRVVNPGYEPDFDKIMKRGQDWDGADATRRPMRNRDCHANAARLCESQGHQIATGYALSDDGLWRQHSWGIHAKSGKPIETTTPREKYHGVVLTDDEAAEFARANPSHTAAVKTAAEPFVWYHGTPDERTWETGAAYGIHIGTEEAARTALHARIGKPAEGEWDGTREYGKTLLNRDQVHHTFDPETRTFTRHVEHHPPSYPNGEATYSTDAAGGTPKVPLDARPNVFPVRIKGPMTNSPHNPHPDFHANGYMRGQLRRGRAKSGYYYTNVSEDEGSVSAVVPSAAHLERLDRQQKTAAVEPYDEDGEPRPWHRRWPGESKEDATARRGRYIQQVADRHGVSPAAAHKAIARVAGDLDEDLAFTDGRKYGFANNPGHHEIFSENQIKHLMTPEIWHGVPVTHVSTEGLQASQNWLRPRTLAHNLFHPGKKPGQLDDEEGHPDFDPDDLPREEEDYDDIDEGSRPRPDLGQHTRFLRRDNGQMMVVDGHHRAAIDMALGKKTTPGTVIDEPKLRAAMGAPRVHLHGEEMSAQDLHAHMLEHHDRTRSELPEPRDANHLDLVDEHDHSHEFEDPGHEHQLPESAHEKGRIPAAVIERYKTAGADHLVLYHGTSKENAESIRQHGLEAPQGHWYPAQWPVTTVNRQTADAYATRGDEHATVEIHVPKHQADEYLWPAQDHIGGAAYAPKKDLPAAWVHAVHPVTEPVQFPDDSSQRTAAAEEGPNLRGPRQFYHGTATPLEPGQVLEPGAHESHHNTGSHVYMTNERARADRYAWDALKHPRSYDQRRGTTDDGERPRTYVVEHLSDREADPHDTSGAAWRTSGPVRVLREVPWGEGVSGHLEDWEGPIEKEAADSIYIPPPLPEEALERARTHPHQVAASYAQYHARMNHPRVTMRFPRSHEGGDELVGSILRHTGYEGDTEGSFVARHPRPENKTSNPSWLDGKPGVALHPDSWDYGTVAHEAAHHALMYHHAIGLNEHQPDEQIHGPEWSGYYARGLNYISPGAGDEFLAHKQHYLEEIAARTSQAKTASSDGDGWVTCEQGCEHWGKHGAAGLLIRHRGEDGLYRYLLQKRSDDGDAIDNPGVWSIPSGAIGRHETPEEGAKREYREEHGPLPQGVTYHHTVKSTDHGDWAFHTVVMDSPERFEPRGGGETADEQQGAAWHTAAEVRGMKNRGELHPAFAESWDKVRQSRPTVAYASKTKSDAAYRPATGSDRCGGCVMFREGKKHDWCTKVKGSIEADHVCRFFYAKGKTAAAPARGYHVSWHDFAPGDLVETGHEHNFPDDEDYDRHAHNYLLTDEDAAHDFADRLHQRELDEYGAQNARPRPRVYPVETTGPHEVDPEDPSHHDYYGPPVSRRSKSPLRVLQAAAVDESVAINRPDLSKQAGAEKPQVYLRFGDWHHSETSRNYVTGDREFGVSVYDLDHRGQPKDPDPGFDRIHEHNEHCEPGCDEDQWNEDYGNDTGEEMRDRVHRAERARYRGGHESDQPHLVTGDEVGVGHDGESLLKNVRRVGDWIDHRHLFIPGAERHRLARDENDPEYEPPAEDPRGFRVQGVAGYDVAPRTGMIYLDVPPELIKSVPGGVDDHHITVVYLGKGLSDEQFEKACRRAQEAASKTQPLQGTLEGTETFPPSESSKGKTPAFVPAHVPGLDALRGELEDLSASEHGFHPHVTLAYLEDGDEVPPPHPATPVRFTHLHVKRGDDVRSFPLGGDLAKEADYRQPPTEETWEARRQRVSKWLDKQGEIFHLPSKWGPHTSNQVAHALISEHDGPERDEHWEHLPDQEVSLRQPVHTHQGFVYTDTVKHYLNADADPDAYYESGEYTPGGDEPKFVKHNGTHYMLDGHHRYAKDRLMGHESMYGKVFDTANPEHKQANCYECHQDEAEQDYDHDSADCPTCQQHGWYV